ncbi:hypothetical protein [Mucilaginibacter sp.]|jgi:hypothetical protein|uniref:hypothetical protein n=1 Tax=Mucilaginibacter sp. TaxID=1882438 RepID=UPI002626C535|nr:hypothetical protein [Mucilaginibacter sp.]MDB5129009.1 hypothetical protein [Mucilaginibacter sp.]
MRSNIFISIGICALLNSCTSSNKAPALADTSEKDTATKQAVIKTTSNNTLKKDGDNDFEKKVYFKIDKIYSGPVYEDKSHVDVFYRILEIPEEENISLYAEKISIGDEGGSYLLIKRIRFTDENSTLPKFGLSKVDSLKFIDSVKISGYFNDKRLIVNLSELK